MNSIKVNPFSGNNQNLVYKMNQLMEAANRNRSIGGDGVVSAHISDNGIMWHILVDEIISRMPHSGSGSGSGSNELRLAYCKSAAPAAMKFIAFLDTDTTGDEITVDCTNIIAGGGYLNAATPRLTDGLEVTVWGGDSHIATITKIERATNTVTVWLSDVADFYVGDTVVVAGVADPVSPATTNFNGKFTIVTVNSGPSTITYSQTGTDETKDPATGIATVNNSWKYCGNFQTTEDCTCTTP